MSRAHERAHADVWALLVFAAVRCSSSCLPSLGIDRAGPAARPLSCCLGAGLRNVAGASDARSLLGASRPCPCGRRAPAEAGAPMLPGRGHADPSPPAPPACSWTDLTLAPSEPRSVVPSLSRSPPMSVLDPLSARPRSRPRVSHTWLTSLGADPAPAPPGCSASQPVVVVVRVALLPLVVHGVRQAHAAARARPQLADLTQRYRNRKDADAMRSFRNERRRIAAEHDMSRLSLCRCSFSCRSRWRSTTCVQRRRRCRRWGGDPHLVASLGTGPPSRSAAGRQGYLGAHGHAWP